MTDDQNDPDLEATISRLPEEPAGEKLMQAVVMSLGPGGTRMLELTRSGAARKGVKTWVDGHLVNWLTTDRSALIPVMPGELVATYEVRGPQGKKWRVRASKPSDAVGGTSGTLPASKVMIGQFRIVVS